MLNEKSNIKKLKTISTRYLQFREKAYKNSRIFRENKSIQILETKNLGRQITDSETKFDIFAFKERKEWYKEK